MTTEKLKEISINGYKSISPNHPLTVLLDDINILLGANGSGKSNVISFFKMLNFMMKEKFQIFVELAGTSKVFLHYGAKNTNIEGQLTFESDTNMNKYRFLLTSVPNDRLIISLEEIEWGKKGRELQKISLDSEYKESAVMKRNNDTVRVIHKILSTCKVYQFHDTSDKSPLRQSSHVENSNYLQADGSNLASFLYYLKENEIYRSNYNRITGYVQLIMPQFKDFYFEPNEKGFVSLKWENIFPNDYISLPEQFSDGTIRFIALATLLLQPPTTIPRVIIIDEPELGLHPFAIGQLAAMIKEASRHAQVVVATQSSGLVDEFDASQITVIEAENGYSTSRKLDEEDLKDWLEQYSLSQLWNKNILGGRP